MDKVVLESGIILINTVSEEQPELSPFPNYMVVILIIDVHPPVH
jgi:hypothetical protein